MKPNAIRGEIEEEEMDMKETTDCHHGGAKKEVNLTPNHGAAEEMLRVHCSEEGFYFTLQCCDGLSRANSQLFTWKQIAQLLIAAHPDMFGIIDEPLHQVFPESLERLGYYVPNWKE
jgi:hypothetical protein